MNPPALTPDTFKQMNDYFEAINDHQTRFAVLSFSPDNECVVELSKAYAVLEFIASGMQYRYAGSGYRSPSSHKVPTLTALTPYQYKVQWLANYFHVEPSEIHALCKFTPTDQTRTGSYVDYTPPVLDYKAPPATQP